MKNKRKSKTPEEQVTARPVELEIQRYLRSGKTPEDLTQAFGIACKAHSEFTSLVLFKYDQLASPMAHPIVQEARGLILDAANNWSVVAFPMTKFFNHSEELADKIDWSTTPTIQEKADGSMCTVYHYNNKWLVATSGTPDASGEVNGHGISFAKLFWRVWSHMKLRRKDLYANHTYVFELMSMENKIVVPHSKPKLNLICVRSNITFKELDVALFADRFPVVKEFQFGSMEAINQALNNMNGLEQEGFVVRGQLKPNGSYARIKCKAPSYLHLHHLKDSLSASPKNLVEIIRNNESTEFLAYFQEYQSLHDEFKAKFEKLVGNHDALFEELKAQANGDRKAFAALATKTRLPAYFFNRLDNKVQSVRQYLQSMKIDYLMELLKETTNG